MIAGNKGEWSELYVLIRLLADGRLYSADSDLKKMDNVYLPIRSVYRKDSDSGLIEYKINEKKYEVELYSNGDRIKALSAERLKKYAEMLYRGILSGTSSSFRISDAEEIMHDLKCSQIKAPSEDKTDIQMKVYDTKTGYNSDVGYSIKSELGKAPTLLNASGATNFRFELKNIPDEEMSRINGLNTKTKIRDRLEIIRQYGPMSFAGVSNNMFHGNLLLIDSRMEEILSKMLLEYYENGKVLCSDIATAIEKKDPLGYNREGIYRYKIKKFLCAVALGMMPSKKWDGRDEANGGYIIVKESGEVLAYHLYNRNYFENYLLNNTRLETASTTKHKYGSVYEEDGKKYFNLNLQVRFV